jgi:type IV pilus assembly protein PilV
MNSSRERFNRPDRQGGFSLLEVMVAATVLGFGLAGVAALALGGLSQSSESRDRTAAALLAAELGAHLRLAMPCPAPSPEDCPLPEDWRLRVSTALPGGEGALCRDATPDDGQAGAAACDGSGAPVLKLFWRGPQRPERLVLGIAR